MVGLVENVTDGCVLAAAAVIIRAQNVDPEKRRMMMSNLSPSIYIMAAFASSAASSVASSVALPKILTRYFVEGEDYDTYRIPAGTKLFKSYRDKLEKWSLDKVFPVKSPAYFGFDEPNVSENYGFAFAYKTTQPYELLAIDSKKTLAFLWDLAKDRKDVRRTLRVCFGYDPDEPKKTQIRSSDEDLDFVLVHFLCEKGYAGYTGDYIATEGGGQFHPECVICGDPVNVELNPEYNVTEKLGLASPIEKHSDILRMLMDRNPNINPKKPNQDTNQNQSKRSLNTAQRFFKNEDSENENSENEDSENEDPNNKKTKSDNFSPRTLLNDFKDFGDNDDDKLGGGSQRKKRTQKKRVSRRHKRTQKRHKQKKNKSRK